MQARRNLLRTPGFLVKMCAILALAFASTLASAQTRPLPPGAQQAPIAYLYDMNSGQVLFAREENRRFMPASITKVMTTFLAFEWLEEGRIAPDQRFAIRPQLWNDWKGVGSTMFLAHDDVVSVDRLIRGVTTVSANDGAAVLAEGAAGSVANWVAAMNEKAAEIGMRNSRFGTPNGWMDEGRTFTTAKDLTILATHMVRNHPDKYRRYIGRPEFTHNGITQPNHDPISGRVPGADGIKTGFTNQAGVGFLGSAERGGRRLVVLVAGGSRVRERNRAVRDLLEWGYASFEQQRLYSSDEPVGYADVQNGSRLSVGLVAPHGIFVSRPMGLGGNVSLQISYDGPLRAPIRKGEKVAELEITPDGMPSYTVPLVAGEEVQEAGVVRRIVNGVVGWFR